MKFNAKVVPVARGHYGPFDDGRTIDYVELADPAEGGSVERATAARDVQLSSLELFKEIELTLELYRGDGKLKLRCHGPAIATPAVKAA